MDRRKFIKGTLLTSGIVATTGIFQACKKYSEVAAKRTESFMPDLEFDLISKQGKVNLFRNIETEVYHYEFKLVKGNTTSVQEIKDSYLGPIIRVRKGQKIRVNYKNQLNDESIVHWHGLHLSETMDGHPRYAIEKNQEYVYEFQVLNRAGTYWFHPHPHGKTGPQVYGGLAGLFIVSDDEEKSINLPKGRYDVPLVIQDRTFNSDGQLVYLQNPMEKMIGFLGNQILINGKPDFKLQVSSVAYRFRLLNGSNSRIYKVAFSNGMPLTVIGTDGGLLESPIVKDYVVLAPAERIDLIVDFSGMKIGDKVELVSLPFPNPNMSGGMMGGMGSFSGLPNGSPLKLAEFRINKIEKVNYRLPKRLSSIPPLNISGAINVNNPRTFRFAMSNMSWTINGRTFGMTEVASDEKVRLNTTEVWEFINGGGRMGMMGGMMQMPHPVHIHQLQFRIIERSVGNSALWESLKDGFVDNGWKDSFLLLPGMRVKVLLSFKDYSGLFLYHCHNLEHEDMGMMRNYFISS